MKVSKGNLILYTATLITAKAVIPAKAGIQENTRFRVEPGMTNRIRLMSSCIKDRVYKPLSYHSTLSI